MVVVNGYERPNISKIRKSKWVKGSIPKHKEIYGNFSYRKLVKDGEMPISDIPDETGISDIPSEGSISDIPDTQGSDKKKDFLNVKNQKLSFKMHKKNKSWVPPDEASDKIDFKELNKSTNPDDSS